MELGQGQQLVPNDVHTLVELELKHTLGLVRTIVVLVQAIVVLRMSSHVHVLGARNALVARNAPVATNIHAMELHVAIDQLRHKPKQIKQQRKSAKKNQNNKEHF